MKVGDFVSIPFTEIKDRGMPDDCAKLPYGRASHYPYMPFDKKGIILSRSICAYAWDIIADGKVYTDVPEKFMVSL